MLNVDSGGGQVSGMTDTFRFLEEVGKRKPVTTYTSGMMASAAYALGVTSQHLTASDTSTVGSIGVLAIHMERSKQLEEAGIKTTVIRAGAEKASNNSFEPLSDIGRATLQSHVDHL
jgi:ClpP class serine protease